VFKKLVSFWVREIRTPNYGTIVAVCDKELLDKKLWKGQLEIVVSKEFYGERLVDEEEIVLILQRASSLNLMGERIIELAEKLGLIHKDAKMYFRDKDGKLVPHALMIKIRA